MAVKAEHTKFVEYGNLYATQESFDDFSESSDRSSKQRSKSSKSSPFAGGKLKLRTKNKTRVTENSEKLENSSSLHESSKIAMATTTTTTTTTIPSTDQRKTLNQRFRYIGKSVKRFIIPPSKSETPPLPEVPTRTTSLKDMSKLLPEPEAASEDHMCRAKSSENVSTNNNNEESSPKCELVAVEFVRPKAKTAFGNDLARTEKRVQLLMARDAPSFGWAMIRASNRKIELKEKELSLNTEEELLRLKQDHVIKRAESTQEGLEEQHVSEELQMEITDKLVKERARCQELEQLLEMKNVQQNIVDTCIFIEKEKLNTLKDNFAEERTKRLEVEEKLQVRQEITDPCSTEVVQTKSQKQPAEDSKSVGNTTATSDKSVSIKRKTRSHNRSLSSHFSGGADDLDLYRHLIGLGHDVEHCLDVQVNQYSCRGFLNKMGKRKLKMSWKKRWFVFHRKMKALSYYEDDRSSKSRTKRMIYFQSIQEVYVDSSMNSGSSRNKSGTLRNMFCLQTSERVYILSAPSLFAMGIWIDVLCTGKEGALESM